MSQKYHTCDVTADLLRIGNPFSELQIGLRLDWLGPRIVAQAMAAGRYALLQLYGYQSYALLQLWRWYYLSIPKLQLYNRWSLGMDK